MRILADENIDRPIVEWLREQGHDVVETVVAYPGERDVELVEISRRDNRVLMTFDRDIGRIVLSQTQPHPGVIFLRLNGVASELWDAFKRIWPNIELVAPRNLVTVRNHQLRQRPLPSKDQI